MIFYKILAYLSVTESILDILHAPKIHEIKADGKADKTEYDNGKGSDTENEDENRPPYKK